MWKVISNPLFLGFIYLVSSHVALGQPATQLSGKDKGQKEIVFHSSRENFTYRPTTGKLQPHAALREINGLLSPIYAFYGEDRTLVNCLDSTSSMVMQRNGKGAFEMYERILQQYHQPNWTKAARLEIQSILSRMDAPASVTALPYAYEREEQDNQVVEKLYYKAGNEVSEYIKITHDWGGVYYYNNESASSAEQWERAYKLYLKQQ